MYTLDKVRAKEILIKELGYEPSSAEVFVSTYPEIHDELAPALMAYLKDRTFTNVSVNRLSLNELMRLHNLNYFLAVRELNMLLNPDMSDEQRNRLTEILRERRRIR